MSRFQRAIHGIASSYVLLAATAVYSLASVPVALHYLDQDRFALWVLMGTLAGYLTLIDAGMTGAAARLLIDYKDDRNGGSYGSLIKTGWLVSLVQAAIIFLTGQIFARTLAELPSIPVALRAEFISLVNWQCVALALSFATRMFNLVLCAHQRMDWVNYVGVVSLLINFAVQWVLFHFGFGVLSLAGGSLVATVVAIVCQRLACDRLKLFPQPGGWGRFSWLHFKELFNFGKDLFLINVGNQLILASQTIIITGLLNLGQAALWSIGLRVFNLLSQIVWRISDMSGNALAEMLVRGELTRLRERYRNVAILSFSFAGWVAVSFAACNSLFITLWLHNKVQWPAGNNWLLAVWLIISAIVHCHINFVLMTKQIGFTRYIYFLEGLVFVGLACLVTRWGGLPAIIGCSIICSTVFSGAYGVWRVSRFFGLPFREIAWGWLRPMSLMLLLYLPVAVLAVWLPVSLPVILRLGINVALASSVGIALFLRYGLPVSIQNDLLDRVPDWSMAILKRLFITTTVRLPLPEQTKQP